MLDLTVEKQLPVINTNFEMVKAELKESIKKYVGMVVTEDTLKSCKADQGELASVRIKIDNYRKTVKKEISKPIIKFEDNCKILIGLVTEAENPIKIGIAAFDQKKKDANRKIAENIILNAIEAHGLKEKYSIQLNVLDKYCNLSVKAKEVIEDVERRSFSLLQEQDQEIETLQIMNDLIEKLNKTIDAKLSIQDFQSLINMNASPIKVIAEINERAERIKESELKAIEERKLKEEKAAAVKQALEQQEAKKIVIESIPEVAIETILETSPEVAKEIKLEPKTEPEQLYFIEMRFEGNMEEVKALSNFLRSNGFKYSITDKGAL